MTNTYTYVHGVEATRMQRLPDTGTISVQLGNAATLMFDDDAMLVKFIRDLNAQRADMLNSENVQRDVENIRLTNGNLA